MSTERDKQKQRLPRLAYSINEIADAMSVSSAYIRMEIARGKLATVRAGRRVLIPKGAFDAYVETSRLA